jgi:ferritin-like protein
MTPEQEPILQFFGFAHLREDLAKISKQFHDVAHELVNTLPRNPERTTALRKLLEAKDCAVRASLYK